jgi:hypothetical protein
MTFNDVQHQSPKDLLANYMSQYRLGPRKFAVRVSLPRTQTETPGELVETVCSFFFLRKRTLHMARTSNGAL